jgi:ABC-2 type transport system permease protein
VANRTASGLYKQLTDGNVRLANDSPKTNRAVSLATVEQRDQEHPLTFFLPYIVNLTFYISILGAASLLLNSVTKEKENQMIEALLMSTSPQQMLIGKIIGLGLLGLLQITMWVGTGRVLLLFSGQVFQLPQSFQLATSFLVWSLIFFLLGYAINASLLAGLGALVPNLREASQFSFLILLPMMIPLFLISIIIEEPNGVLAVILSIFPLSAPVAMMTRLAATEVPAWQPWLAASLMAVTAVLIVRAVARMFRTQTLLSGQPFKPSLYWKALIDKE